MMPPVMWKGLCCCGIVLLAAVPARGQSLAEAAARAREQQKASGGPVVKLDDYDLDPQLAAKEVLNYEVTAERWGRFQAVMPGVNRVLEKDAALLERLSTLKGETARVLERFIAREPALVKVLTAAGTNPHDFAFTQFALVVALLLNQDQRAIANKQLLPPATQANMELVRIHEKELKALIDLDGAGGGGK